MSGQPPYDLQDQPPPNPPPPPGGQGFYQSPPPAPQGSDGKAIAGLVLGIFGFSGCLCPLLGFPITIIGLVFASQARPGGMRTAGMVLNIIALILTVINAAWGVYLGVTGEHPLVN